MVTKEQKKKIRRINQFEAFYKEVEGIPFQSNQAVHIPDVWAIKQVAINRILKLGFDNVSTVEPKYANCIIRIFTKRHFKYEMGEIHNVYGFNCFVKENGIWLSESNNLFKINFLKHVITCWLSQDESVDYDCDFVDCYVRII